MPVLMSRMPCMIIMSSLHTNGIRDHEGLVPGRITICFECFCCYLGGNDMPQSMVIFSI